MQPVRLGVLFCLNIDERNEMKMKITPMEALVTTMLAIMGLLFACSKAFAGDVADGIRWTVQETDNLRVYGGGDTTRAHNDPEYRTELEAAFLSASDQYNIPVFLLVAMAYYETIYRNQVGDDGRSHGIMQVGKMGRSRCKCDMGTVHGQINCGACWLDMGRKWCGNLDGGLYAYINGSCNAKNGRANRAFKVRNKMWAELEDRYGH